MNRDNILLGAYQRMYKQPTNPISPPIEFAILKHLEDIKTNYPIGSQDMFMSVDALLKHYSL